MWTTSLALSPIQSSPPFLSVCQHQTTHTHTHTHTQETVGGQHGPNRVTQTFYRKIYSFVACDPEPLVEGGTRCLRLTVHGQSFMLHHIRHMIGTAVRGRPL